MFPYYETTVLLKTLGYVFTGTITFNIIKWLYNYIYKIRVTNKMKGLPMLPFIGSLHLFKSRSGIYEHLKQIAYDAKDDPIFKVWIGPRPFVFFHKADYLETCYSTSKSMEKSKQYQFFKPWFGETAFLMTNEKSYERRRLIMPAFHLDILNDMLVIMNEKAEILVDILAERVKTEPVVEICDLMFSCMLDTICESSMGICLNAMYDSKSEYRLAIEKITQLIIERIYNPLYWNDFIYSLTPAGRNHDRCLKILHDMSRRAVKERLEENESSGYNFQHKRLAFLDLLLKSRHENPSFSLEDVQAEVNEIMFAGHDTTACATTWACHLIGSHPDIQRKIQQEIDSVMGETSRPLNKEDLNKLDYLECAIKETLRLFPSAPFVAREIMEDGQVDKFKILAGETAVVLIYMVHRDEKYYPDPEKFDPDRFLPENSKNRPAYAFIPFSAGRRNCIGQKYAMMEMKVIMANMLRKFDIESIKTTQQLNPIIEIVTKAENGIPLKLTPRTIFF